MNPAIATIQRVVADEFRVTTEQLCSRERHEPLATARRVAMALCRELTGVTWANIADAFGGRHHNDSIYARASVQRQRETQPLFAERLCSVRMKCRAALGLPVEEETHAAVVLLDAIVTGPDEEIALNVARARRLLESLKTPLPAVVKKAS